MEKLAVDWSIARSGHEAQVHRDVSMRTCTVLKCGGEARAQLVQSHLVYKALFMSLGVHESFVVKEWIVTCRMAKNI